MNPSIYNQHPTIAHGLTSSVGRSPPNKDPMDWEAKKEDVSIDLIQRFKVEKVLHRDPFKPILSLLGSYYSPGRGSNDPLPAVIKFEKTPFPHDVFGLPSQIGRLVIRGENDMFTWLDGYFKADRIDPDVKIELIVPANEMHVKKYGPPRTKLVKETPLVYQTLIKPYIEGYPKTRLQWLYNILDGRVHSESILYSDPDPFSGFVIVPDSKWDRKTPATLHMQAIARTKSIASLRDVRAQHLTMLRNIKSEAERIAGELCGVEKGQVRMLVHYHPMYYHFHVTVFHITYRSFPPSSILLDEIISLMELEEQNLMAWQSVGQVLRDEDAFYAKKTFNYELEESDPLMRFFEVDLEALLLGTTTMQPLQAAF
ncbi:HIT-like protein [Atractiella rhizophila]|nr:HIT-like protein [Atractiella rhizophila]